MNDNERGENSDITADEHGWQVDADALLPKPAGHIKIKGTRFPIWSFLDVPIEDSVRVTRLIDEEEKAPDSEPLEIRAARTIQQLIILNGPADEQQSPRITEALFKKAKITPMQLIKMGVMALSVAKIPLKAAAGSPNDSASPSPASVASSDGGQEPSGA